MSTDGLSPKQMINIELATRARNTAAKKVIKQRTPSAEQKALRIAFSCECSDPACNSRVPMTLAQYEKLHQNQAAFVLAKGHEEPQLEKISHQQPSYSVVEKFAL
jgi:hypothetical protein